MIFKLAFIAVMLIVVGRNAHAYLDPGTGSMIIQVILGGAVGLLVGWRFFWRRLKQLLRLEKN